MRRWIAVGLASLVLPWFGAKPVRAHTDTCVLTGTFFSWPSSGWQRNWFMSLSGACAVGGLVAISAGGDMWVEPLSLVSGTGVTSDGHRFAFTGKSVILYAAGEVTGTFTVLPTLTPDTGQVTAILAFVR